MNIIRHTNMWDIIDMILEDICLLGGQSSSDLSLPNPRRVLMTIRITLPRRSELYMGVKLKKSRCFILINQKTKWGHDGNCFKIWGYNLTKISN